VAVDGRPQRRPQPGDAVPSAAHDTRTCRDCHDNTSLTAAQRSKPAYEGVDLSGLNNIQSSSMSWDYIKRLRDQTKMKMVLKGIMTGGCQAPAEAGIDGIIVSNHGGRSEDGGGSTIEALPEIIQVAGSMRS